MRRGYQEKSAFSGVAGSGTRAETLSGTALFPARYSTVRSLRFSVNPDDEMNTLPFSGCDLAVGCMARNRRMR
jgi:hypothetical protein